MPRKPDARLEGRILDAAYRMWSKRGERALTMRAVACASGTTTPTLYERFSNKGGLLAPLRRRARLKLFAAIQSSRTPTPSLPPRSRLLWVASQRLPADLRRLGYRLRPQGTHAFVRILETAACHAAWW